MNGKKNNRYQENLKENKKSQKKNPIKLTVNGVENYQRHLEKQESKSVQQMYLYRKIHEKPNLNLHSTGHLLKNHKNSELELCHHSPIQLCPHSPIQNRLRPELFTHKEFRIDHLETQHTSDKNRRHRLAVVSYKNTPINKTPSWILNRKKQRQSDSHSVGTHSKSKDRQKQPSPIKCALINNSKQNKNHCNQNHSLQSHKNAKKPVSKYSTQKKLNIQNSLNIKQTSHTLNTNMNQSSKFQLLSNKLEKMTQLELRNIKLDQQLRDLKFKYQNLQEDNNLLLIRLKTLESESELCQKRLKENIFKQEHYRETESLLREKIEQLEKKILLVITKQTDKGKSNQGDLTNYPSTYFLYADKQILNKKNEQIDKLNTIIIKLRERVKQINHELSQQKIRNITTLRNIEQRYEIDCAERQMQIRKLSEKLELRNEALLLNNTSNFASFKESLNKDYLKQSTRDVITK